MNSAAFENSWMTAPDPTENKNPSYFSEFTQIKEDQSLSSNKEFDPYYQAYSDDMDDFLTQTLESLQELDIPIGEQQQKNGEFKGHRPTASNIYSNMMKGHKKKPSGTAIFGFMGHNKTLSIPGLSPQIKKSFEGKNNLNFSVSPSQLEKQQYTSLKDPNSLQFHQDQPLQIPPPPQLHHQYQPQREPVLFQQQQYIQPTLPQHPMQPHYQVQNPIPLEPSAPVLSKPILYTMSTQSSPKKAEKSSDDYIITNEEPKKYKFPPEPGEKEQKTVTVPIEYLQKLTRYIKSHETDEIKDLLGADFENFNSARLEKSLVNNGNQSPVPTDISPLLRDIECTSSATTEVNSPADSPISQEQHTSQLQVQSQVQVQPQSQSFQQNGIQDTHGDFSLGLKIQFENNSKKDFESYSSSNSEFSEVPKTPSPILRSQAQFPATETHESKSLNWTPVIVGNKTSPMKKKTQDKVSTLPPGEIDMFIIGPREDKTYICNYDGCGKLFTRRYNARSHVQTHLCDRPYICPHQGCHKAFVRHHDLTRHTKIHEEFLYSCPCGKRFSRQDALYRHRIRKICSGGINEEDYKGTTPHNSTNSSPIKKSTKKKPIKVLNDSVAKRLEFDLMRSQHQSRAKSSNQSPINIDDIKEKVDLNSLNLKQINSSYNISRPNSMSPVPDDDFLSGLSFGF